MKIKVERGDWTEQQPELVVLVGDPYSDFIGPVSDDLAEKLGDLSAGFASGKLRREIGFSHECGGKRFDFLYFHTSTEKGFTSTETIKTFLSRALHLAADTGRQTVAVMLKGEQADGLLDQVVEGALVGTYSFRAYKKDKSDPFDKMELILCAASPTPVVAVQEVVAAEPEASPTAMTQAIGEPPAEEEEATEEAGEEPAEDTAADEPAEGEGEKTEGEEAAGDESAEAESEEAAAEAEPEAQEEPAEEPEPEPEPVAEVPQEVWDALKVADDSAVRVGQAFAEGVNFARTLVAMPANDCTPDYLAKTAKKVASAYGFSYQAFGPKPLTDHGYIGLITVGKGSEHTPRMIEMTYTPEEESGVHLVLLGKGVTFDTGGISIKGAENMHLMVGDMAGAAAVLGAMEIIGRLKPQIKVTAIVVSAENKPGSKSCRPGDIITYKNGLSVHIENTDAEGRLILADGLIRAGELGATHIVDVATLTGSCSRALGPSFTGVMGANRKLVNAITRAGGNHGESYWRLPLPLEYRDLLKTPHADINNVGGPSAGATTAGLFLKEFVPGNTPWVHLDIAGTFWKSKPWKYYKEGPSGTGVKTLADLALRWKEHLG